MNHILRLPERNRRNNEYVDLLSNLSLIELVLLLLLSACAVNVPLSQQGTRTPSNSEILNTVQTTVWPSPVPGVPRNETGIVPGRTTDKDVKALLGEPESIYDLKGKRAWWYLECYSCPGIKLVTFEGNTVWEVKINPPGGFTADQIIRENGTPEMVVLIQAPPMDVPPEPVALLSYSSKGIYFELWCKTDPNQSCNGVRRQAHAYSKVYSVPMTSADWIRKQGLVFPLNISKWTGFVE